jgi:uncharacterized protein YjbJ (UPF0337 family)
MWVSTKRRLPKEVAMGDGSYDEVKGRTKEAVGDLTDDEELQSEGKLDRAEGSLKDKATGVVDKVRDVAGDVVHKVREVVGRGR